MKDNTIATLTDQWGDYLTVTSTLRDGPSDLFVTATDVDTGESVSVAISFADFDRLVEQVELLRKGN